MKRLFCTSVIYQCQSGGPEWAVAANDPSANGQFLVVTFSGTGAEQRAREYAAEKFFDIAEFQLHSSGPVPLSRSRHRNGNNLRIVR
jgi:hypothetical protein